MPKTRRVAPVATPLTPATTALLAARAAPSPMRAAKLALLLTTAIAWGMTAQSVGSLRTLGSGGAQRSDPVPELVREAPRR